jgi:hypothetical protein
MIYNFPRKKRNQITNYLTFSSPNPFSISVSTPGWDGKLYCSTDTKTWAEWTGNEVNATEADGIYALYFSGTGNTKIAGGFPNSWNLSGSSISCTGNIESLLDYETVAAGQHPAMAHSCYRSMFYACTSLTTAPSLPATKLVSFCYHSMFYDCTSLTTAPSLPATKLVTSCYYSMFYGCTSIKLAVSQSSEYDKEYRIPKSGNGVTARSALNNMFAQTGGTFTGTPKINTTYYTSNTIV